MVEAAPLKTRVKGRSALVKRLGLLVIAVHRFGQHRAVTDDERRWAARVSDALRVTLIAAGVLPVDTRSAPAHAEPTAIRDGVSERSRLSVAAMSGLKSTALRNKASRSEALT